MKCCDRVAEVVEKIELCYYMVIFARERARGLSRVGQKQGRERASSSYL